MWTVYRNIRDYDDVFRWEYSEHETEEEANNVADSLVKNGMADWCEVEESDVT